MNEELKALLKMVFDGVKVVEDAVAKKDFVTDLLPKLYSVAADIPAVVTSWGDLNAEVVGLQSASADADLLAYVMGQVAGVSSDAHAQSIISASLDLAASIAQKSAALAAAIKG